MEQRGLLEVLEYTPHIFISPPVLKQISIEAMAQKRQNREEAASQTTTERAS